MDSDDADPADRFAALHAESVELLEKARSLVGEMRGLLEDCKRRRPKVAAAVPTGSPGAGSPSKIRTHRGARVGKKRPKPR